MPDVTLVPGQVISPTVTWVMGSVNDGTPSFDTLVRWYVDETALVVSVEKKTTVVLTSSGRLGLMTNRHVSTASIITVTQRETSRKSKRRRVEGPVDGD